MIVEKKTSVEGQYAKKGEDVKDGDIIQILDAGNVVEGQYGTQKVFKVKTRNGERLLNLNQKTINNLVDTFHTNDTKEWVGKEVKVWLLKVMVGGKLQTVVYLAGKDWYMDDNGYFHPSVENKDDDEISIDDIADIV